MCGVFELKFFIPKHNLFWLFLSFWDRTSKLHQKLRAAASCKKFKISLGLARPQKFRKFGALLAGEGTF